MKLDLSNYFDESEVYFESSGVLDGSKLKIDKKGIKILEDLAYDVQIFRLDTGTMEINMDIKYSYEEPCNRCLKPTINNIETSLSGELLEATEEDYDFGDNYEETVVFYRDNIIDLEYYITTQIYLSLKLKTLCSEDCKGLCSVCGINLNDETCDCEIDTIDPRLAKLKDFVPKN